MEYHEFLNSRWLDENATALVSNSERLLGVPRIPMLLKAQRFVAIGEFFSASEEALSLCFLLHAAHHLIFYTPNTQPDAGPVRMNF